MVAGIVGEKGLPRSISFLCGSMQGPEGLELKGIPAPGTPMNASCAGFQLLVFLDIRLWSLEAGDACFGWTKQMAAC